MVVAPDLLAVADDGGPVLCLCSCHQFVENNWDSRADTLKTTQTRDTMMDIEMQGCVKDLYICCEFTFGLHCFEALDSWNAAKCALMDCCVNRRVYIHLD